MDPTPPISSANAAPASGARRIGAHLAAWIVILTAMAYMLQAGWQRWNDPIVDFGRELYIPWQITQGKVLYRDLASFSGPLSAYLNAGFFRLFGVGLQTLIYCNIAIVTLILLMVYRLTLRVAGIAPALAACLAFIFLVGFGQYGALGNENYVAPYLHEATHGIALALLAITMLARYFDRPCAKRAAVVGAVLGLVFLTKIEIFLAAAGASFFGVAAHAYALRLSPRLAAGRLLALVGGSLIAPALCIALLSMAMPLRDAAVGTCGSLYYAATTDVSSNLYYRQVMGTDQPGKNLVATLVSFAQVAGLWALMLLIAWRIRIHRRAQWLLAAVVFAMVAGGLYAAMNRLPWEGMARGLPVSMAVLALLGVERLLRRRGDHDAPGAMLALSLVVFAGLMLAKIVLNTRLDHYGFVLAMPALLVFVVLSIRHLPGLVNRRGGAGVVAAAAMAAALAVYAGNHVWRSGVVHGWMRAPVGEGVDRFYAFEHTAPYVNGVLDTLRRNTPPDSTLAVFPEGVMINYLLRRENPSRFTFVEPSDILMFGERAMLDALAAHPPDYVVYYHRDTSQFGMGDFGAGYARDLHAWVMAHYRPMVTIGPPPFSGRPDGGAILFERVRN